MSGFASPELKVALRLIILFPVGFVVIPLKVKSIDPEKPPVVTTGVDVD